MTSKNSGSFHEDKYLLKKVPAKTLLVTQNNINEVLCNLEKLKNIKDTVLLSSSAGARVLSIKNSSLIQLASSSVEKDYEKGISGNNLIFGGSFPIDAPFSAREFGAEKLSKTYQVDIVCCTPPHICEEHRGIQNSRPLTSNVTYSRFPRLSNSKQAIGMAEKHVKRINVEDGVLTYPIDERSVNDFHPGNDYIDEDSSCAGSDRGDEDDDDDEDDAYNSNADEYEEYIEPYQFDKDRGIGCFSSNTGRLRSHNSAPDFSGIFSETDKSNEVFHNMTKKELHSHNFVSNDVFCPQLQTMQEKNPESEDSLLESPKLNATPPTSNIEDKNNNEGNESSKTTEDLVDSSLKQEVVNQHEHQTEEQRQKQLVEGQDEKDDDKKSSGFLGTIFGGWRKNKNEAKLPDDKNPSIVWDENKKKWVNKDGDTTDEVSPPPPPSVIMRQLPPNLRGGPKKSRYVDPVGEKGRTKITSNALPAPIPNLGAVPPPKGIPSNEQLPMPTPWEAQQYPETPDAPSNSPPIQTRGLPDTIQRQRYVSSSSSVDLYDDSDLNQGAEPANSIPMMNPVESQPQPLFFNPAQFPAQRPAQSNPPRRGGPAKRSYNPQR